MNYFHENPISSMETLGLGDLAGQGSDSWCERLFFQASPSIHIESYIRFRPSVHMY